MKKSRPEGICTALFKCKTCPWETYQRPGAFVSHKCPKKDMSERVLKEVK